VALVVVLAGCSSPGDGQLSGSLSGFYDFRYESVRARLYASEFSVEYTRSDGEVPVRLTLTRGPGLRQGATIALPDGGTISGRSNDTDIPRIGDGNVELELFEFDPGSRVRGTFVANFDVGGDTATLTGEFDATLEVVEQVEGYPYDFGPPDVGDAGDVGDASASSDAGGT
jgi:hypothetical protein